MFFINFLYNMSCHCYYLLVLLPIIQLNVIEMNIFYATQQPAIIKTTKFSTVRKKNSMEKLHAPGWTVKS